MIFKRVNRNTCVVVATIGLVLMAPQFSGQNAKATPQKEVSPACSIAISDPLPGARVGAGSTVFGTAKIPAKSHLWILAHKKTFNGWWPQGSGETPVDNGTWAVDVYYGIDTDHGNFEVVAIAVSDNVNNDFNNWVNTSSKTGSYPPIRFPSVVEGCPIAKVTVMKP
jgi:hypothetical protein